MSKYRITKAVYYTFECEADSAAQAADRIAVLSPIEIDTNAEPVVREIEEFTDVSTGIIQTSKTVY